MKAIELEAQKALLAREILNVKSKKKLNAIWIALKGYSPNSYRQAQSKKRKIGLLDGNAKIVFKDDFAMTTEELLTL